ncbi:hypothetical protein C8039_05000 [Halogeometricum sp. wsp3]|nr:hypothetical protein C8039_05000 [Halogeometricum sp. wsp3]
MLVGRDALAPSTRPVVPRVDAVVNRFVTWLVVRLFVVVALSLTSVVWHCRTRLCAPWPLLLARRSTAEEYPSRTVPET